jgi:hypothetical protein
MILSGLDRLHIDDDLAWDFHAEVGRASRQVCGVGARYQRLGWRAAGVDAGPTKKFALDHRERLPRFGKTMSECGPRLPSSDDNGIVALHCITR